MNRFVNPINHLTRGWIGPMLLACLLIITASSNCHAVDVTTLVSGFRNPQGVAVDSQGNVYVGDSGNNAVKKITPANVVSLLGSGFQFPTMLTVDPAGNVYVSDSDHNVIKKIDISGAISLLGSGIIDPLGVGLDSGGNLYVADAVNGDVKKITPAGVTTVVIPNFGAPVGVAVDSHDNVYVGDGINGGVVKMLPSGATSVIGASIPTVGGVAVDAAGNVYVTDMNQTVSKIDPAGVVTVVASGGFAEPVDVAVDSAGNLYVADTDNSAIKKIAANGQITILGSGLANPYSIALAGNGDVYVADSGNDAVKKIDSAGNITTVGSGFRYPSGVAFDANGNLLVADTGNNAVKRVDGSGNVSTVASGFDGPEAMAVDGNNNIYVTDSNNNAVKKIDRFGVVTTVAGGFNLPTGLAMDGSGNLYVADSRNNVIKKIDTAGHVTALGSGLSFPIGVAVDSAGSVYVGDWNNIAVKKISNGVTSMVAGIANVNGAQDGLASQATFGDPAFLTIAANGDLYVADASANSVRIIHGATSGPAAVPAATPTAPDAPGGVFAAGINTTATVSFSAPGNNGGSAITGYTVSSHPAGGVDSNAGSTALSHVMTNLSNGIVYNFTVTAANAAGVSAPSGASNNLTLAGPPGMPGNVVATAGNAQASISFTAPADNGSSISGYTVTSSPGGFFGNGAASPIVVSGLSNGTSYSFTVTASNLAGPGAPSAPSNSVTPTAVVAPPSAPVCTLSAAPGTIAAGGSSILTAACNPAATSYVWTNSGFGASTASGSVAPTATTTYTVVGSNSGGSGNTASVTVTVAGASAVQFAPTRYGVAEAAVNVVLTVTRSGDLSVPASVQYATCGSACSAIATAIAGSDFTAGSGTVNFAAGVASQTISVALTNDTAVEGNETFTVVLSNPSGASIGNAGSARVTILDGQGGQLTPVGQLYNITSPDNADESFLRFYNLGSASIPVVGTLYDQDGAILGTADLALTAGLRGKGVLVLGSADIAALFGVASWSGRAWMEVKSTVNGSTLLMQNLVRSTTLTNMSCVSDRFAVNIPAGGNTDQAFVRLYNTGSSAGTVRATLHDQDGNVLGSPNSILLASLDAKAVSVLTADMIQAATGAPAWSGRAWLDISADFGSSLKIMNLIRDPSNTLNDMSCVFPLNSVGQLYNIAAPDNADSAYLRFYNSGTSAGTVSATLYDQNGVVLGTQGRVLTANLPANGVLALASADIANQFGVATWSGRAWMEVTTSLPDGSLLMQNLVRSSTLTNMTCVSDRVAVNIPAGGNTDQAFVRLYNVGSSGGAVRGTLYDQDGNILGGANSILLPSLAGKAVAVLTADMIQAATGASGWGGRAWLDLSADFGSNLKIMNLIRDPSNTLNDMSCAFD